MFMSRLYLGMHTVLDIVAGLALAILMMVPLVPLVDFTDHYFVTETWALTLLITLSILTIVYYPRSDKWTPTRQVYDLPISQFCNHLIKKKLEAEKYI